MLKKKSQRINKEKGEASRGRCAGKKSYDSPWHR
jgi:hypothetical protein